MNKSLLIIWAYMLLIYSTKILAQNNDMLPQIYDYKPYKKIHAEIGIKSQNRISFSKYGIREIIGDDNLYQLIHDSNGQNIFIIPKISAGEIIDITIISNSNKVQDLSLKIIDDFGKIIVINVGHE